MVQGAADCQTAACALCEVLRSARTSSSGVSIALWGSGAIRLSNPWLCSEMAACSEYGHAGEAIAPLGLVR